MHSQSSINLRDPRSKLSNAMQAKMNNELHAFLKSIGCNRPRQLQLTSIQSVGSIMTDIFRQLEPNFAFGKKIEDEFIRILKVLQYPYQITKNDMMQLHISRNSNLMLSAIHWVMEIVKYSITFNPEEYTLLTAGDDSSHTKLKWELLYCLLHNQDDSSDQIDVINNFNEQLREKELESVDTENVEGMQLSLKSLDKEYNAAQEVYNKLSEKLVRVEDDVGVCESEVRKIDDFIDKMSDYNSTLFDNINELTKLSKNEEEKLKMLKTDILNANKIVKTQPFDVEDYLNMRSKMLQNKRKLDDFYEKSSNLQEKKCLVDIEMKKIKETIKQNSSEIYAKCKEIQNYFYLKEFMQNEVHMIAPLIKNNSTFADDDKSITDFVMKNGLKENLNSCETLLLSYWQKIEKESDNNVAATKMKIAKTNNVEHDIFNLTREFQHLEQLCLETEKKCRVSVDMTSKNDKIFNLKKSIVALDQDVSQMASQLEELKNELESSKSQNCDRIHAYSEKLTNLINDCKNSAHRELKCVKYVGDYYKAKLIDIRKYCEL